MEWKGAPLLSTQQSSSSNKRLPETPAKPMTSRRIPPGLPGQPQPQSQQQSGIRGNDTILAPVPAPAPGLTFTPAAPISPGQVITLVHDAWKRAGGGDESRSANPDSPNAGITLDLTSKNIPELPDEVIDILRNGVERLALSHNALSSVPIKFSQCSSLRYLAARNNAFDEFPLPLCELTSLEFLDLSRNRLKSIPQEIARLGSLKALAVQDNLIESLPPSLAGMTTLQRLKLTGNPIKFPPRDVLQPPGELPPTDGFSKLETIERAVTAQIKNFLSRRQNSRAVEITSESEGGEDGSSEGADTPRLQSRRATGRFPIRVKGSENSSSPFVKSSSESKPPPIPGRSHFRDYSQVNATSTNSGKIPLSMGRSNESLRSTSVPPEPLQPEPRSESLSSLREAKAAPANNIPSVIESAADVDKPKLNRFSSHLRGFSYSGRLSLTNPFSPDDPSLQRPLYVRELPALPVRRYGFQAPDPILEVAKGILYSIFQIHLGVQTLMSLTNDGSAKRSSLEMVFYNTNVYFEELEQAIQDFELSASTKNRSRQGGAREHDAMHRAYTTLINAYVHICAKLISSVNLLVDNGDQRYMRTFLMLVYHSIMELRVTLSGWISTPEGASTAPAPGSPEPPTAATSRPPSRAAVAAALASNAEIPNTARLGFSARRPGKVGRDMQVRTDIPYTERSRRPAATVVVSSSAASDPMTPSSDDSFTSAVSSPDVERNPGPQPDMISSDGDRQFERFFVSLKQASDLILRVLPGLTNLLTAGLRKARSKETAEKWELFLAKGGAVIQQTEILQDRLSTLKFRDPGLGVRSGFWILCNNLFGTWAELGDQIKLALVQKLVVRFPPEIIDGLRQISRSMKDSIDLMVVVRRQAALHATVGGGIMGAAVHLSLPPPPQVLGREQVNMLPLPMTPQSAALGPAFRATKPFVEGSP